MYGGLEALDLGPAQRPVLRAGLVHAAPRPLAVQPTEAPGPGTALSIEPPGLLESTLHPPPLTATRDDAAPARAVIRSDSTPARAATRQGWWMDPRPARDYSTWAKSARAAEARRLASDLISDDTPFNAGLAARELAALGSYSVPALRLALSSRDEQQKMYATLLLAPLVRPTDPDLLRSAYELLKADQVAGWRMGDDTVCTGLLIRAGQAAWPVVRPGLHARDPQQRFLAASVLAHTRCSTELELTVTILCSHLCDNAWVDDAGIASRALYTLGPACLPVLTGLVHSLARQGA